MFNPEAVTFVEAGDTCSNRAVIRCNWQADAGPGSYCRSCAMTEIIPQSVAGKNVALWDDAERAKRWVLSNLGQWGWMSDRDTGLRPRFHLLSEETSEGPAAIIMGHDSGLITINVTEADPAVRVARREELAERYRTLVGHFRHEIGHYVFLRLVTNKGFAADFRDMFGDERADYGAALKRHYEQGPPNDWWVHHVTPYASAHPHEDWAETFAHLLHLTDMVDSFQASDFSARAAHIGRLDPYKTKNSAALISGGIEIGIGMNHVNRSMGLFDLYPFVLSIEAREKLEFVHNWVRSAIEGKPKRKRPKRAK